MCGHGVRRPKSETADTMRNAPGQRMPAFSISKDDPDVSRWSIRASEAG